MIQTFINWSRFIFYNQTKNIKSLYKMKKILLIVSLCLVLGTIYGQIPNSSFESWNSTPYDEPTGFQTGNRESVSLGIIPITRVNGTSGYAVRLETIVSNGDTAQAYIANGDPMDGIGGIPFAEQATAITGYYRYQLPANDTALILVMFKKNGNIISNDVIKIKGTGTQNTFTSFSYPLSLAIVPDSFIIAATSSNILDNVGIEAGSFIELDGLAFAGAVTPIDNGSFESWDAHSNDALPGWETYGDGFAKTTDSYEGTSAVSLTTMDYGNGNISGSGMTSGHYSNNGPSTGGHPFTLNVDTLTGYYKYITSGNDSASINISLSQNSNFVGGSGVRLPSAAQYTYFEIPISSFMTPDSMKIDINSSIWPYSQSSVGSTLYIDKLQMKSDIAAGLAAPKSNTENMVIAYPNPANEIIHLRMTKNISDNVLVEVYDLSGKLMIKDKKKVNDNSFDLQISALKPGNYFYRIYTNGGRLEQAFTKN